MKPNDVALLLQLRQHRHNKAMAHYAKAQGNLSAAHTQAQDAEIGLKEATEIEKARKQDAYRTLPGRRLTGLDLQRHHQIMKQLEACTDAASGVYADALVSVGEHQQQLDSGHRILRQETKSLQGWQALAEQLRRSYQQSAMNKATIEEEDEVSDLFTLQNLGGWHG
ncbi:hypothetical protein [Pseudaestuariivita rosea]|uniref:hypothetical protein n=1 Tax=Pseudaestuariivita rosea TaxID=2763263 RepID=UPI001ABBAD0F|nr:hypothetical protein [Pseudaestuariivita rosea]